MASRDDVLPIRLYFDSSEGTSAGLLIDVVSALEQSLFELAEEDLRRAREELPIPAAIADAALYRLRQYRGQSLQVMSAESGSIVLGAAVAGLTIWLLEKTLGETFGEAWKETEAHHQLKGWIRTRIDSNAASLRTVFQRRLRRKGRFAFLEIGPPIGPAGEGAIEVFVPVRENEQRVPRQSDLLRDDRR